MRVLLIPDKFKGSLSAEGVINAIRSGISKVHPKTEFHPVLASDGGDGFLKAISQHIDCDEVKIDTVDPLGRNIKSSYLLSHTTGKAFIELANASGLERLAKDERRASDTSTYGTGLEIKDAISNGATKIYVGLGGSATNDAGMGIANALGYRFLDGNGDELRPIGRHLAQVARIERQNGHLHSGISVFAVNDVDNPLYGEKGAAHTYAKQKGASDKEITELDAGLKQFSNLVSEQLQVDSSLVPGAGAAGGTAYGLNVFVGAKFISGIDFILNLVGVAQLLQEKRFDYIITGEGKFDDQTLNGKLIKGVADLGNRHGIPVIAVCGQLDLAKSDIESMGLLDVLEVKNPNQPLHFNMANAAELIEEKIEVYFRKNYKP